MRIGRRTSRRRSQKRIKHRTRLRPAASRVRFPQRRTHPFVVGQRARRFAARAAGHLDVYQRRAVWVFAKPDFKIPRVAQAALKYVPGLQTGVRGVVAGFVEVGLVAITVYLSWRVIKRSLPADHPGIRHPRVSE